MAERMNCDHIEKNLVNRFPNLGKIFLFPVAVKYSLFALLR